MDETNNTYRRVDAQFPLSSVTQANIKRYAKRQSILVRSHNLTVGQSLWKQNVASRLMIIRLDSDDSAGFSFCATEVYPRKPWRKQHMGGLSFALPSRLLQSQLVERTAILFKDQGGHAFLLVLDPSNRTHGEIGVQILSGLNTSSGGHTDISDAIMNDAVTVPSDGHIHHAAGARWRIMVDVRTAEHACIVTLQPHRHDRRARADSGFVPRKRPAITPVGTVQVVQGC
ncbi:hypothetical protein Micbo1qcDRAFT_163484 [Microdochium bolleyi]|uniref:Uncharacterized protein n=1 Tax=Microdochium bolleyi TaxID=196109 RepID=A0A136J0W7_9PEZI|nr:hypothetical protein Micbo1qcDRAFT_163484 [Microdochium bolleyi]